MNYATLTAIALEDAREVGKEVPGIFCQIEIPAPKYGKYVSTQLELRIWGPAREKLRSVKKGHRIFVEGTQLFFSYNKETKVQNKWLQQGNVILVPQGFNDGEEFNSFILAGRCVNDLSEKDCLHHSSGFMSAKQRLAVWNKVDSPAFYTFKANYNTNSKYKGINYAEHIMNFLNKKNVGATIRGSLVTETWKDKATQEDRFSSVLLIADKQGITLSSKLEPFNNNSSQKTDTTKLRTVTSDSTPANDGPEWSIAPNPNPSPIVNQETPVEAVSESDPF